MRQSSARIEHKPDGLHFFSSYDASLVAAMKGNINSVDRAWNGTKKCWVVAPQHLDELVRICELYLNVTPSIVGASIQGQSSVTQELFRVEYIGGIKDRGAGEMSAFGATQGKQPGLFGADIVRFDWPIIFPESVLKDWFQGDSKKETVNQSTLYAVLAIKQAASQDDIKAAWRKQVKRFHPDINSDEDAGWMTVQINHAYEVLRNPMTRRKYDAGLKLAAGIQGQKPKRCNDFMLPVRCGLIMCSGQYKVGRFVVSEILQWHDIVEGGRTLVTSWDTGTNSLVRNWI